MAGALSFWGATATKLVQAYAGREDEHEIDPCGRTPRPACLAGHRRQYRWPGASILACARAQPGALAYGITGVGGTGHFGGETLCRALSISLTHVPYRGTAPLMQDVIGGRVPLLTHGMAGAVGPYQGGYIRPLAVLGSRRAPELPDVPTMAELGHPVPDSSVWFGIMAPAGTPPELVARVARDLEALSNMADTRTKLATQAAVPNFAGPQGFATQIRTELATWREIARSVGIRPE